MDQQKRVELIRLGNQLFNEGDYSKAAAIFEKTMYKDGLTRIGDYLFYDKRQPLFALKYYQLSDRKDKVNEIFDRMVFALGKLMGKEQPQKVELPPLKVSPKLKILAEEILRDQKADK